MRNDLKALAGVSEIETDLDEQTCSFKLDLFFDAEEVLNALADKNSKFSDWTITN